LAKIDLVANGPTEQDLQEYITWVLTQDASKNPLTDLTGERAARNQGRKGVWFVPGGTHNENQIVRECTVPANTEILIFAATADSSYLEHKQAKNDDQLLAIAKETAKLHKNVEITISHDKGKVQKTHTFGVKNARKSRKDDLELIEVRAFPIIFPEDNAYRILYGVKGGYTHLAIVGWGIKVRLEPGKYKLILKAQHEAESIDVEGLPEPLHSPRFNLDIIYTLSAIEEEKPLSPFNDYPE
jgi:hypothetical protein